VSGFLGQVPLALDPGSWGFHGTLSSSVSPRVDLDVCPDDTFVTANGTCRPFVTHEGIPKPEPPIPIFKVPTVPMFHGAF
jgi:hypothetical protein